MTEILEAMLGYARENYRSYYDDVLIAYLIATNQKERDEIENSISSQVLNIYKKRQGITDDIDKRAQKAEGIQGLLDKSSLDATAQFMAKNELKSLLNQQEQEKRKEKDQQKKRLLSQKVKEQKDQILGKTAGDVQAATASALIPCVAEMKQGGGKGAGTALTAALLASNLLGSTTHTNSGSIVPKHHVAKAAVAAAVTPAAAARAADPVAPKRAVAAVAAATITSTASAASPLSVASSVSPAALAAAPAAKKLLSSVPPPEPTPRLSPMKLAAIELNKIKGITPNIKYILDENEADSFDDRKKTIDSFRGVPGTTLLASINVIIGGVKSLRQDKPESLVKKAEGFKEKYLDVTASDEEITDVIAKKELGDILDSLNGIIELLDPLFKKKGKGGARKTRRAQKTRRRRARKTRR
jgi:hypothetical protein